MSVEEPTASDQAPEVVPAGDGGLAEIPPNPDYPARMNVDYPAKSSRLLIFVRWLTTIPHWIALFGLGIGAFFAFVWAWFVVLFTAKYPQGVFDYVVGVIRWAQRVMAYQLFMTDEYPPFSLEDDPSYPVRVEVQAPPEMHIARWRALLQGIMAYPAAIAAGGLFIVAYLGVIGAWFAILFTGRYPKGIFRFVTVTLRWSLRVTVYQYLMTERYPPFVMA
ncbi:MAG: DUF4389 domain-containing protein [Solirubrobacteraceae bacterium]